MRYIKISPRGFSYFIARGSKAACVAACGIVNNDPIAWAEMLPASHKDVRNAIKEDRTYPGNDCLVTLAESDVRKHRPVLVAEDGSRSLGGSPLPA